MADVVFFDAITETDGPQVGGKALSLGRMARAGLPVPSGFVVTVESYRRLFTVGLCSDVGFVNEVLTAYHQLGAGLVAVRSSATAEDGAEASFAGQQETRLGVSGDEAVLAAIESCWKSLHSERAIAYRQQKGIDETGLAMAVVVQKMVPADVAGVLFTRDPQDPIGTRMSIEASWGLGEAVVSGKVTPDRFQVNFDTGTVVFKQAGDKTLKITVTGEEAVEESQRRALCLTDNELSQLAELGRRVEQFYGDPRDVEWALHDGQFHVLQARPITTSTATERETVRTAVIAKLQSIADPRGTVWVRYNLSEVLPEPLPMTWGVVQRLIGADGGFGAMNRDLGASPDPMLGSESAFDLIAGRPMCNLSRMPRMQFPHPPIEYPFDKLKANPRLALDPKPVLNPMRDGLRAWLRLPGIAWRLYSMSSTTRKLAATFADEFTTRIVPPFVQEARDALNEDWSKLDSATLFKHFHHWTDRTLVQFARHSLKPTVFADLAWNTLFELLKPKLGEPGARTAISELASGTGAELAVAVKQLADGTLDQRTFMERFGHRCQNEMELAQPRWSETPNWNKAHGRSSVGVPQSVGVSPAINFDDVAARIAALAPSQKHEQLSGPSRGQVTQWAERLRVYLGLREAAKNSLMLGYAVIRKALVELGRTTGLRNDVFCLQPEELPELIAGKDFTAVVRDRKKHRQLELSLHVPAVVFSDTLDAIGRPEPVPVGATTFEGVAISVGSADGLALVLTEPTASLHTDEPYILVCPSTDPAWVPLFVHAKGLIMETGGVLSHGAIVAREFGLPAVAGLPGITKQIRTGQRVRVDGTHGTVMIL